MRITLWSRPLVAVVLAGLAACGTNETRSTDLDPNLIDPDVIDGDVELPDGATLLPDGAILLPDGGILLPDGSILLPDGSILRPDGSILLPDGGIVLPDGGEDAFDDDDGSDGDESDAIDGGGDPIEGGGAFCETDGDCAPGLVCELSFGIAFCTPEPDPETGSNCESDSDCVLADSDQLFCCAGFFGTQRCAPAGTEEEGASCGDGGGLQGDDCTDGGQSDCDPERASCVFDDTDYAYCAELCVAPAFACEADSYCFIIEPGREGYGLCVEYGETETLQPCGDDPTGCAENSFCVLAEEPDLAFCAVTCETSEECPDGQGCNLFGICETIGPLEAGESCAEDRFACGEGLFCINYGTRAAQCAAACDSDRDCTEGSYCFITPDGQGLCIREGDREAGAFCGDDPNSCAGVCSGGYDAYDPGAVCYDSCTRASDCAAGQYCGDADEAGSRYCLPDGELGQGESCALDAFACQREFPCVGYGGTEAFCSAPCTSESECGAGNWCVYTSLESGYCVPAGTQGVGESCEEGSFSCEAGTFCGAPERPQCFQICTDEPDGCPSGQTCLEAGEDGIRYCFPFGDRPYGTDCADDEYACEFPTYCAENFSEQARCTVGCEADRDCPPGEWCAATADGGVCRPDGTAGALESCEGDLYACEPGLNCLLGGRSGAFCAEECTGFASSCDAGQSCTYIGFSRSVCIATGDAAVGESCADDQFACEAGSWCIGAGTDSAVCVQTCSFAPDSCDAGTRCRFLRSGFGLCLAAGLAPEDPLNPGGTPL